MNFKDPECHIQHASVLQGPNNTRIPQKNGHKITITNPKNQAMGSMATNLANDINALKRQHQLDAGMEKGYNCF